MIEAVEQVLKPTTTGWRVVTRDSVLRAFLEPGGDYTFLVMCHGILDEGTSNSGNLTTWRLDGDTVVLGHADTVHGPECRIKRTVLEKAIARLAEMRGELFPVASPKRATRAPKAPKNVRPAKPRT